jgi:tetratricopeptide (TPR) repeat protein
MDGSTRLARLLGLVTLAATVAGASGCRQVRGRKILQDASELYKKGRYVEAIAFFERAESLVPELPVLWLNKGYTCRQLIQPAPSAQMRLENRRYAACALDAFAKLKQVAPTDARADQLYVQTLFDANDLTALETMFLAQARAAERRGAIDLEAAAGLQQVYFKQGNWARALSWARKTADARPGDADAQYRLGAFVWQLLSSRGGGAEMTSFDPRGPAGSSAAAGPGPGTPKRPPPPLAAPEDISGALRSELADEGIHYLENAIALRPRHPEAMIYLNLLYRQKSFAFFAEPDKWQAAVDKANEWQRKGLDARGTTTKL